MNKMFGKKVKCFGYMKKHKTKYVVADKNNEVYKEEPFNTIVLDGEPMEQDTYVLDKEEFEGVVIGTKNLSTRNYYDYSDYKEDSITVIKQGFVECYVVAYKMNCKRYVPKDRACTIILSTDRMKLIAVDDIVKKPDKNTMELQYKIYKEMLEGRYDKEIKHLRDRLNGK